MSIIQAYKSDEDNKIFEHKTDYTKHLRKLAAKRREVKRLEQHAINRESFLDKMGQVGSFDELEQFIKDNWVFFRTNSQERNFGRISKPKDDNLIGLSFQVLLFYPNASNSHKSPRKGVENFDTRADYNKGKPTSYPGWKGRITFGVTYASSFGSGYFDSTPICTGSGGGGANETYSYDLTLFAADFPVIWEKHCRDTWVMKKNQERQHVWRQLGGKGLCTPVTEAEIPSDWVCPDPLIG
jgi:hypothetical protein